MTQHSRDDENEGVHSTRRGLIGGAGAIALAVAAGSTTAPATASAGPQSRGKPDTWPVDFSHRPIPEQAPARKGSVTVDGAELAYWDTGGSGPTVVFMHARSGSLNSWPYQQPVLARQGFRVIAYSRRGHEGSTHTSVGYGADDLRILLDELNVTQAHLIGHAAGGLWALDFALTHPDRLQTLTIACSTFGLNEPDFNRAVAELRPEGFEDMPPEFRELGPSYRSADPKGVRQWQDIERRALNDEFFYQGFRSPMDWSSMERLRLPVLLLSTDADMYMTPTLMHQAAAHLPDVTELTIIGSGHCPHWERSEVFNHGLSHFFRRRGSRDQR